MDDAADRLASYGLVIVGERTTESFCDTRFRKS
jgi:hypothetical protein